MGKRGKTPNPLAPQLVLTATVDGVDLVAVGWKQDRESILYFIMTRCACLTLSDPNKPHVQHWTDDNGNTAERELPRPKLASMYFKGSNAIGVPNHHRQKIQFLNSRRSGKRKIVGFASSPLL